jgi:glycosyltransferase involved in cell wall biosynthesis
MGTKIAVYTIALNEEKHVERWFNATKDADYHLIADTGSTDKTIDIAKSLGINVVQISVKPFRFDDARNAALAVLPVDVDICLSLDMDEIPEPGFFDKVREGWVEGTTKAWVWWDTGNKWKNNNRLHARHSIRWIKPCHEVTVSFSGPEKFIDFDLTVYHKPDDTKSRGQYLPMLKMAVDEDPSDARMWHYLIREYYFHQDWFSIVKTVEDAMKAGGWNVERAATCRATAKAYQHLNNLEMARDWYVKGVKEAPDELEPWYALAQFNYEIKNWQGCWDCASKREVLKRQTHYQVDSTVWDWRCYDLLAISGWYLGKHEQAIEYGRKALENNPSDKRLHDNLKIMQEKYANL